MLFQISIASHSKFLTEGFLIEQLINMRFNNYCLLNFHNSVVLKLDTSVFYFLYKKRIKLLVVYRLQLKQCKCLHVTLHKTNPVILESILCTNELPIRNAEAYRFTSAYHVSWSFACAELAM